MSVDASTAAGGIAGMSGRQLTALAAPLLIVMILAMMVLPLPAILLDLLFTFNIALSMHGAAGGHEHLAAAGVLGRSRPCSC
jgi:flagellar biosynthesis component FlhA